MLFKNKKLSFHKLKEKWMNIGYLKFAQLKNK